MFFAEFIQTLHGIVGKGIRQALFTETILKQIVSKEAKIDRSDSAYKGYYKGLAEGKGKEKRIVGDQINKFAQDMIPYLDKEKFIDYLKGLEFNMTAKNQLCDSFRKVIPDININNVFNRVADLLENIIKNAANSQPQNNIKSESQPDTIVDLYTITDGEKKAIKKVCEIIDSRLKNIYYLTNKISDKETELNNIDNDASLDNLKAKKRWKETLEYNIKLLKSQFNDDYAELEKFCLDFIKLCKNKKHLHKNIEEIYNIVSNISDEKYKITCATFRYNAFSLMKNSYKRNYDALLRNIDRL